MNDDIINKITNKYYRSLKVMYDHKVKMSDGSIFVPMTQVEVADIIGVSKITMNAIIKSLKGDNLLYPAAGHRARYYLTDKAMVLVEGIQAISFKINDMDKDVQDEKKD